MVIKKMFIISSHFKNFMSFDKVNDESVDAEVILDSGYFEAIEIFVNRTRKAYIL